jgi:hypothetical protein
MLKPGEDRAAAAPAVLVPSGYVHIISVWTRGRPAGAIWIQAIRSQGNHWGKLRGNPARDDGSTDLCGQRQGIHGRRF